MSGWDFDDRLPDERTTYGAYREWKAQRDSRPGRADRAFRALRAALHPTATTYEEVVVAAEKLSLVRLALANADRDLAEEGYGPHHPVRLTLKGALGLFPEVVVPPRDPRASYAAAPTRVADAVATVAPEPGGRRVFVVGKARESHFNPAGFLSKPVFAPREDRAAFAREHGLAWVDPHAPRDDGGLPRTPDGDIDNCALANGAEELECQMCGGNCPDAARLRREDRAAFAREHGLAWVDPHAPRDDGGLPRTPDGHINNCALANGAEELECQMCGGNCPDAARLRR